MIILRLFEYFERYLVDKSYKVTICNDKIHVLNYLEVEDFSNTRVIIRYVGGKMIIHGMDLVVSKMESEELLIDGKLLRIEYN